MDQDTPFSRALRRLRRARTVRNIEEADYLHRLAAEELLDRLSMVRREFKDVLVLGGRDGGLSAHLRERGLDVIVADAGKPLAEAAGGVQCDEDRLPFGDGSFDLVASIGVLDSVNDLPGALTLVRRALRPDGLFLGAFAGAGSLPRLRSAMTAADAAEGAASPRLHPQIDLRAAGDLLTRAGFKLQVADSSPVEVRFSSLATLVRDLRAMGATNILNARSLRPIGRSGLAAAIEDFNSKGDEDGKTVERFEIIYLTGWSPSPDQPQPARRGSATASLADALRPKS
jgi:SAM-dependent methyltransferase